MLKIKASELKEYRLDLLRRQKYICPICTRRIEEHQAVLDHDHINGNCRAVLHRECNAMEGKLHNWYRRFGKDVDLTTFLRGLIQYLQRDFSANPLHPTHRTPQDKEVRALRRRLKAAKTKGTQDKLKQMIKEIKDG